MRRLTASTALFGLLETEHVIGVILFAVQVLRDGIRVSMHIVAALPLLKLQPRILINLFLLLSRAVESKVVHLELVFPRNEEVFKILELKLFRILRDPSVNTANLHFLKDFLSENVLDELMRIKHLGSRVKNALVILKLLSANIINV